MSNSISSVSQTNTYTWASAPSSGSGGSNGSSSSPQAAAPQASDSVTLSDSAQFHSLLQRYGLKVEGGTLGQLFSPAFFAEADANNDARLSSSEFTSFVEQNGGNASQASKLYQEMGGSGNGLSYDQFRHGVGQGDAKDFLNNLVITRIKGSSTDPTKWLQGLARLGDESDAASSKIAKELTG